MEASSQSWPRDALPRGTDLHGYEIEAILGRGGFGITYRVRDKIDQSFALKECFPKQFAVRQNLDVLPTDSGDAEVLQECLDRFMREAKALVHLSRLGTAGDGIVKVTTFFEAHGTAYIVMEYLAGESLEGLIKANPTGIPADRLGEIMRRLLHALGCVHDAGLLHRDVKPSNISLREDGRPVLIDFGATRGSAANHTVTYTKIFSESYSPIEQFSGGQQGPYSDIYALGMTCYRAIGGSAMDAFTRQQALLGGRPDPLPAAAQIGAGRYPASLLAAIDAALAVAPGDRPQSAGGLLALLDGGDRDTIVITKPPPAGGVLPRRPDTITVSVSAAADHLPAIPAKPPAPPSRRWAAVAIALLLVVGGVAALLAWQHQAAVHQTAIAAAQQAAADQAAAAAAARKAADQAAAQQAAEQATAERAATAKAAQEAAARQAAADQAAAARTAAAQIATAAAQKAAANQAAAVKAAADQAAAARTAAAKQAAAAPAPTSPAELAPLQMFFGRNPRQIFGPTYNFDRLPIASEYRSGLVRYVWKYVGNLPGWQNLLGASSCLSPHSYIVWLFKYRRLFRVSIRLYNRDGCDYSADLAKLSSMRLPGGITTRIRYHDQRYAHGNFDVFEFTTPEATGPDYNPD